MAWAVYEADRPEKLSFAFAVRANLACGVVRRGLTGRTFVEAGVSVAYSDSNAPSELFGVSSRPDSRQRLDNRALSVIHVS